MADSVGNGMIMINMGSENWNHEEGANMMRIKDGCIWQRTHMHLPSLASHLSPFTCWLPSGSYIYVLWASLPFCFLSLKASFYWGETTDKLI